jgi:hypothetical protein
MLCFVAVPNPLDPRTGNSCKICSTFSINILFIQLFLSIFLPDGPQSSAQLQPIDRGAGKGLECESCLAVPDVKHLNNENSHKLLTVWSLDCMAYACTLHIFLTWRQINNQMSQAFGFSSLVSHAHVNLMFTFY